MKFPIGALALVFVLAACGSNEADLNLSPAGEEGRALTLSKGCSSCHGANGQGTVGPPFVGLFGSERPIQGMDDTVTADRAYLELAIREPAAQLVEGYNLPMPQVDLTDDEIDAIIDYIEELADVEP